MWGYISFRALLALIVSLIISAWFGEKFIKFLKSKQITETQRDASIDPFGVKKIGVPSMGGVIIIMAILIPVILLGRLRNMARGRTRLRPPCARWREPRLRHTEAKAFGTTHCMSYAQSYKKIWI